MNNGLTVYPILRVLKTGTITEPEAVAEFGDLAKHQLLDWDCLRRENETLCQKVEEWCRMNPPKL